MSDLTGKTALVTGGARGIGLAIAERLAKAGAAVTAADLAATPDPTEVAIDYVKADAMDPAQMGDAIARASAGGRLDICVANAGVGQEWLPFEDTEVEAWSRTVSLNLVGVLVTFQAAARQMMAQPDGGGALVAISSVAGMRPEPDCPAYSASKAGVIAAVESLAIHLGRHGIRVNAVAPGQTDTPGQRRIMEQRPRRQAPPSLADATHDEVRMARRPLQRMADPDDIANAVLFLASDAARHVNGATIAVDGGDRLV